MAVCANCIGFHAEKCYRIRSRFFMCDVVGFDVCDAHEGVRMTKRDDILKAIGLSDKLFDVLCDLSQKEGCPPDEQAQYSWLADKASDTNEYLLRQLAKIEMRQYKKAMAKPTMICGHGANSVVSSGVTHFCKECEMGEYLDLITVR